MGKGAVMSELGAVIFNSVHAGLCLINARTTRDSFIISLERKRLAIINKSKE